MFKRFGHVLLIVALLAATGGHWVVLQTVAWTNMLANNLHEFSFAEAVQRTFDGQHPCGLCCQIKQGKKSEQKTEFSFQIKKLEFISASPVFVFNAPQHFSLLTKFQLSHRSLGHKPLLLPPRSLAA